MLVNGDIPDCGDVTWERIKQYSLDGGWDFILKDIDGERIEELLIGEPSGITLDSSVEKIWYMLKYEDGHVKVLDYNLEAYSERGVFVLNNNNYVRMDWSSLVSVPQESKYYNAVMSGEVEASGNIVYIYSDYNRTQKILEYQVSYIGNDVEYFINGTLVSEEELRASMQSNVFANLIPQDQIFSMTEDKLREVLVPQ